MGVRKSQLVLIVEDEKDLASLMARVLREAKARVVVKRTGKEAIRYLQGWVRPVDTMILDLRLPDISGLEVLRYCRALAKYQEQTKIVVVTAFGTPEVKEEALRLGADAFFDKPIPLETLVDSVIKNEGARNLAKPTS